MQPNDDDPGDFSDVYRKEREVLAGRGPAGSDARDDATWAPNGICLSGGGVRSAVTCIGILGALSERGVLKHFDYLSTVSGGGYAGTALTTFLHRRRDHADPKTADKDAGGTAPEQAEEKQNEPNAASDGRAEADRTAAELTPADRKEAEAAAALLDTIRVPFSTLDDRAGLKALDAVDLDKHPALAARLGENRAYIRHLRANISYLMPTGFGGMLVGLYALLRAMLLNLFVWIVLAAAAIWVVMLLTALFAADPTPDIAAYAEIGPPVERTAGPPQPDLAVFRFLVGSGVIIGCILLAQMVVFSLASKGRRLGSKSPRDPSDYQNSIWRFSYEWRRWNEKWAGVLILAALVCFAIGGIPWVAQNAENIPLWLKGEGGVSWPEGVLTGAISTLFGAAAAIFVFVRSQFGKVIGQKSSIFVILGSALLVYGAAVLAFVLADAVPRQWPDDFWFSEAFWALGILILALLLLWFCSINEVSLGRFYRDRLMEAFLPDDRTLESGADKPLYSVASPAFEADKLLVSDLSNSEPTHRPLHLVNTNVMGWWSGDSRAQRRKGDNFVLSSVCCGSDITGWRTIGNVARGNLSLPTAMAVSGAAVNPSGGFAGAGPTTLTPVVVAMSLLSLRLGYWLRWRSGNAGWIGFGNRFNPPAWHLFRALLSPGKPDGKPDPSQAPGFIELTDGGHFENLGLYELIRRRCRLIVICDAGEDRGASYAAFTSAIRRVREDFGARIEFDMERDIASGDRNTTDMTDTGPQDLVERAAANEYPKGSEYAKKGYFLASVSYRDPPPNQAGDGARQTLSSADTRVTQGLIIYLKSAMIPSVEATTKGYRGANPNFPYDPTSNQFFTAEQFEAYRDLGHKIAEQMIDDLHLDRLIDRDLWTNPVFRQKASAADFV